MIVDWEKVDPGDRHSDAVHETLWSPAPFGESLMDAIAVEEGCDPSELSWMVTRDEMFQTEEMSPIPPGDHPPQHDHYHITKRLGTNIYLMFNNHPHQRCDYLILINTETGQRKNLVFTKEGENKVKKVCKCARCILKRKKDERNGA